jgi:hypothetical protein
MKSPLLEVRHKRDVCLILSSINCSEKKIKDEKCEPHVDAKKLMLGLCLVQEHHQIPIHFPWSQVEMLQAFVWRYIKYKGS